MLVETPEDMYNIYQKLTQKMHLTGTWMTEKSFAATPLTCHDGILEVHKIMQKTFENCIMTFDKILLKSKDFEGIHVPVYKNQLHFLG